VAQEILGQEILVQEILVQEILVQEILVQEILVQRQAGASRTNCNDAGTQEEMVSGGAVLEARYTSASTC